MAGRPCWGIVGLALFGLAVSSYLTYEHFCGPIACIGQGCAIVNESVYCTIFGVPISVLGIVNYAAILGLALAAGLRSKGPLTAWLHLGVFGLSSEWDDLLRLSHLPRVRGDPGLLHLVRHLRGHDRRDLRPRRRGAEAAGWPLSSLTPRTRGG